MNTRYLKALAGGMLALAITVPPATSAAKKKKVTKVTKATTTVAPATTATPATTAAPATTPSAPVTTAVKAAAIGGTGTKCNKVGGTFIDNWDLATSDAQHIDPGITAELIGAQIINSVWDGLTRVNPDTGELLPDVAESWSANADSTVWTFKLKKGIKFSNGEDVLPSSFKKTWERNVSPALGSEYADLANVIKGWKEIQDGKGKELAVVADDANLTLTVNLSSPYGLLPQRVSHTLFYPLTKEGQAAGKDYEKGVMIGNGAFKMDGPRQPDQQTKLVRSDSYFGGINGHPACLDALVFKVSKDPISAFADFEAGNSMNSAIPVGKFADATKKYGDRATKARLTVQWVGFNWHDPILGGFGAAKLRQAIGAAIDRASINNIVFNGSRKIATGFTPPGIPGYKAGLTQNFQKEGADPALAKKLIAEYAKPIPKLTYWYRTSSTEATIAQIIQANLKDVGIDIDIQGQSPTTYFSDVRNKNPQMFRAGWAWDYSGYDNGANQQFHTTDDSSNNLEDFSVAQYDQLVDKAQAEGDAAKQASLYQQSESIVLDQAAVIPLIHDRFSTVLSSKVDQYPQNALGFVEYSGVSLK